MLNSEDHYTLRAELRGHDEDVTPRNHINTNVLLSIVEISYALRQPYDITRMLRR